MTDNNEHDIPFPDYDGSYDPQDDHSICDSCPGCIRLCRFEPFPDDLDYYSLIDAMVHEINDLEAEVIRTRQALLKHLPRDLSQGLYSDIFSGLSARFEGNYRIYDDYINWCYSGADPMEDPAKVALHMRLRDGTDETSYTWL